MLGAGIAGSVVGVPEIPFVIGVDGLAASCAPGLPACDERLELFAEDLVGAAISPAAGVALARHGQPMVTLSPVASLIALAIA